MGGSSGGGGGTPYEAPESGRSKQLVKIVEVISEGEIQGFGATNGGFIEGDGEKSIYFDNTPVRNQDNSHNFNNVQWQGRTGSQNQALLAGFDTTEKEVSVSTEVKKATPITRTITDPKVNRVRLTLGVSSLFQQNDNSDTNGTSVDFKITVGSRVLNLSINGKYSSQYLKNLVIDNLPRTPFTIKVERVQADSTSQRLQNKTLWASYTEIIDHQFTYPNTALIGIKFDSEYFSNIPTRTYDVLGIRVQVPSNYNPTTRQYSGLWDGSFKIAWTDNPAWILYDIVTNKRYGLGKRLGDFGADKWALYQVAQYCDQLVPDGFGNREPRFTCNVWLTEQRSAYDVINDICSIFRAMPVWNGTTLTVIQDRPSDPVWTYTAANVIGGFSRQYSAMKARHNAIQVEYKDKENNYETAIEYVSDDEAIRKYGLNLKKVQAFGCTSRGQAYRTGRWILETERLETETITFTVGAEGLMHLPGDIIKVADSYYAGTEIGGRVLAVSGRNVTLDREIQINGNSYLSFINANAQHSNIKISAVRGKVVTLDSAPTGLETLGVWSLTTQNISAKLYRAMSVAENEDGSYTITALQHEPQKEAIVDNGATFEPRATTLHQAPKIEHLDVAVSAGNAGISWQAGAGSAIVSYDVKILKDGKLYDLRKGLKTTELDLSELPDGNYQLVIQSRNATGQIVDEKSKTFVIDRPPVPTNVQVTGGLTDVILSWGATDEATQTEIWASERNDLRTAKRVAKVTANIYTHTVGSRQVRFYWLRHTRGQNLGEWYQTQGVRAETGANIDAELEVLNEKLKAPLAREVIETALPARNLEQVKTVTNVAVPTQKQGANLLYNQADGKLYRWNGSRYTAEVPVADLGGTVPRSKLDNTLLTELTAATNNIAQERTARTQAIAEESAKYTRALQDEARARGTAITQLQREDERQAGMITTATAKSDQALSGLEEERTARVNGDKAESEARRLLTTRVGTAEGQIASLQRTQTEQGRAITESAERLTARLDGLRVGGRNLMLNSKQTLTVPAGGASNRENQRIKMNVASIDWTNINEVTLSVDVKHGNDLTQSGARWYRMGFEIVVRHTDGTNTYPDVTITAPQSSHFVGRISRTCKISKPIHSVGFGEIWVQNINSTQEIIIANPKLEIGNVATNWTPAPEDGETALSAVSAEITAYKQTQAEADRVEAAARQALVTKISGAESAISLLQQGQSNQERAISETREQLTARLDNLRVGGRNLLRNSGYPYTGNRYMTNWTLAKIPKVGEPVTVTLWGELASDRQAFAVYNTHGYRELARLQRVSEGVYSATFNWRNPLNNRTEEDNSLSRFLNIYAYPRTATSDNTIKQVKLELGTLSTDWTPAPEDVESSVSAVSAEITAYKQTQAEKERVQALEKSEVSAKLRGMESNITTTSQAVTNLNGTLSALHTIKAQTIANGRTAIAGIALGANEKESSVIVMADKFAVVKNAQDDNPQSLFAVQNGRVAINGDLVATGSITGDKLNVNSAQAAILTAGAIRTEHLAAAQVSADKLAIGLGGNLLYNPIFANNADGWTIHNGNYTGGTPQRTYIGHGTASWTLKNALSESERMVKLRMAETITTPKNQWIDVARQKVRLVPNQWYMFSVYANAYRCSAMLLVEELNDNGSYVRGIASANLHNRGTFANGIDANSRNFVKFRCPASGYVEVMVRANNQTADNPDVYIARPMLEECTEHTTQPSAWQNAGVTTIHGGSIKTRTITAEQIGVGQITTEHMTAGTIDAKVLKANTVTASRVVAGISISSPTIEGGVVRAGTFDGGSININNRFKVNNQGQVEMRSASDNVGLVINNEQILVYDQNGRIRVKIGKLG